MTAEEHYKEIVKLDLDKFDKKAPKFDYYDLIDFAESYAKAITVTRCCETLKDEKKEDAENSAYGNWFDHQRYS